MSSDSEDCTAVGKLSIYSESKKTGLLQLISDNFTKSQHSLIISGVDRPHAILY